MKTGTFIDLIPGGLSTVVLGLAGLLCVASVGVQQYRIVKRDATIATLRSATQQYANAQATNLDTIGTLQRRLTAIVDLQRLDAREAAEAAMHATDTILLVNQRNIELQGELDALYARNPQARAWAATAVDPAVLRILPAGSDRQDKDRGSAGAGAGAAHAGAHAH